MSELALIPVDECDDEELEIVNSALVADNTDLQRQVDHLREDRDRLYLQLEKSAIHEADVLKARLALHSTSSLMAYLVIASAGPFDESLFAHPRLAAVLLSLNLFVWTLQSVWRRFA